jgi:hypothetical protein
MYKGVPVNRYRLPASALANFTENPFNCAYSNYGRSGVLNMTDDVGAPVFASKPYFLDGDPAYYENITGYVPPVYAKEGVPRDLYDTFLDVSPISGTTFNAHKRLQINVQVEPIAGLEEFQDIWPGGFYLPVCFADESSGLPQHLVDKYQSTLGLAKTIAADYYYAGTGIGGVMFAVAMVVAVRSLRESIEVSVRWKYGDLNTDEDTSPFSTDPPYGETTHLLDGEKTTI